LQVQRPADADAFLTQAEAFLLEREAEHNLLLGIAGRLRSQPRIYGEDPYFAVAVEGERVVAVALRTPPHNLVLSTLEDAAALEPLAEDAFAAFGTLPGLIGPTEAAAGFARLWRGLTGKPGRISMRERIYRAEEAHGPHDIPGRLRPYEEQDGELVLAWLEAFAAEAMPEAPPDDATSWLERRREDPDADLVLWDDDGPVSLGGSGSPTPNGIRVGPIYTPPELRRRGYASALTAGLTQMAFERGRRFCFLFTDLANPTSNSIYQRIGYRPVADFDMWSFEHAGDERSPAKPS
jgi:predicted GNAT family acetyltransferase